VLQIIRRLLIRPQCFRLGRHSPVGTSTRGSSTPSQGTHNGDAERAIRPLAVGRGNWLHVGGDDGLKTASVLLSVCASATRHRLNPWSYLNDVLDQLAARSANADMTDLLPDNWSRRSLVA
jgi:IS66 C-terminal element